MLTQRPALVLILSHGEGPILPSSRGDPCPGDAGVPFWHTVRSETASISLSAVKSQTDATTNHTWPDITLFLLNVIVSELLIVGAFTFIIVASLSIHGARY